MGVALTKLCSICARGGSKGVPGKNARQLMGKPLIVHTIHQAMESKLFDSIAVSSDADEILSIAEREGAVPVQRPLPLATDQAPKVPAILHCLLEIERQQRREFEILVDLDASSPLRSPADIKGALDLLLQSGAANVITGCEARRSPYFNMVELTSQGVARICKTPPASVVRRQDAPACYDMNASIYAWRRDVFVSNPAVFYNDTRLYVMPPERSFDIDSELDWRWVEFLMERERDSR